MSIMSTGHGTMSHRTYPELETFRTLPPAEKRETDVFLIRKGTFWHHRGLYTSNGRRWKRVSKTPVTRAELDILRGELNGLKERVEKLER